MSAKLGAAAAALLRWKGKEQTCKLSKRKWRFGPKPEFLSASVSGAACRWKCAENLGACSLWAVPRLKLCSGGSASPRAPTSGFLWCLQKVEAWQSPTRFSVIQRAKIKQIKQYYYYFFFGPCSKLHSTAVALCVGMKYVK